MSDREPGHPWPPSILDEQEDRVVFPDLPGWRFYLGLGVFVGYAAGALTIGAFWWWGL